MANWVTEKLWCTPLGETHLFVWESHDSSVSPSTWCYVASTENRKLAKDAKAQHIVLSEMQLIGCASSSSWGQLRFHSGSRLCLAMKPHNQIDQAWFSVQFTRRNLRRMVFSAPGVWWCFICSAWRWYDAEVASQRYEAGVAPPRRKNDRRSCNKRKTTLSGWPPGIQIRRKSGVFWPCSMSEWGSLVSQLLITYCANDNASFKIIEKMYHEVTMQWKCKYLSAESSQPLATVSSKSFAENGAGGFCRYTDRLTHACLAIVAISDPQTWCSLKEPAGI